VSLVLWVGLLGWLGLVLGLTENTFCRVPAYAVGRVEHVVSVRVGLNNVCHGFWEGGRQGWSAVG